MRWLIRIPAIAAGYFLLAWVYIGLAPEGAAWSSPYWPASGLALGVVYCYSRGYLGALGVALGSFFFNWSVLGGFGDPSVPFAISTGAALQAVVGAGLMQRYLGEHCSLTTTSQLVKFAVLVGPVASTINGFIGPTAIRYFLGGSYDQWTQHVLTWWAGDAIGAIVCGLGVIAYLERKRPAWRERWVWVVGLSTLVSVGALAFYLAEAPTYLRMFVACTILAVADLWALAHINRDVRP